MPDLRADIPAVEALVVAIAGQTVHVDARQRFIRFADSEALAKWWPTLTSGGVDYDLPWVGEVNILNPAEMPSTHADRMASRCDTHEAGAIIMIFCVVRLAYGSVFTEVRMSFRRDDGLPDAMYELIAAVDRRMQHTAPSRGGGDAH